MVLIIIMFMGGGTPKKISGTTWYTYRFYISPLPEQNPEYAPDHWYFYYHRFEWTTIFDIPPSGFHVSSLQIILFLV